MQEGKASAGYFLISWRVVFNKLYRAKCLTINEVKEKSIFL